MPVETAREAFAVCESYHADLRIFSDGYACTDARSIALAAARAAKKDGTEAYQPNDGRFTILRDAAEWMSRNAFAIEKLCVFFENPQQAAAALPRFHAVPGVEIVQGSPKNVEVTAAGVDKGRRCWHWPTGWASPTSALLPWATATTTAPCWKRQAWPL